MGRGDDEGPLADAVAGVADDEGLAGVEAGDAAAILLLLGVAKGDAGGDAGAHGGGGALDGAVDQGGALAVPGHDNARVGALARHLADQRPEARGLVGRRAARVEVAEQRGRVGHALDGDSRGAQAGLEGVAEFRAGFLALLRKKKRKNISG